MPFISEEIWQHLAPRKEGESIMWQHLCIGQPTEEDLRVQQQIDLLKQVVAGVRSIRNQKQIAPKEALELEVVGQDPIAALRPLLCKLAYISDIKEVSQKSEGTSPFMVGTQEFAVPLGKLIDVDTEREKLLAEQEHLQRFLASVRKKLENQKFVANAPAQVVELERKKERDTLTKLDTVEKALAAL